jgi:hypothetical protein
MATAKYFMDGPEAGLAITAFQQTSSAAGEGGLFAISNVFDASRRYSETVGGANVATAGNGLDATDVAELLAIPAGTLVLAVFATVLTAEGGTQAIEVGDGADPDGWVVSFDANGAVGLTKSTMTATAGAFALQTTGGKHYESADTIDITATTNAYGVGKMRVTALCFSPVV